MATFTWTPDNGASKQSKPTVTPTKFGDGYEQRAAHGINTNPKTWTLSFKARDNDEADEIEEFLDARAAVEAFDWTPPQGGVEGKYVCRSWTRTLDHYNFNTINATFEEVFEP